MESISHYPIKDVKQTHAYVDLCLFDEQYSLRLGSHNSSFLSIY